ncbi:hypothetical protein OA187_02115 [Candidatus Pelagibacter sp.]|nr:hypothetical protein [Candidatus Pelagibacter sp.]
MRLKTERNIVENIVFEENDLSKKLKSPRKTIYRRPDIQDVEFGAVDYFFYNNGFCNKNDLENVKKYRILTFGDSFTYCTFIKPEDTWTSKIEFENQIYKKINYGMTGIGLYEQYRLMRELVGKNDKIIISAIYEGNDLRDSIKHLNYIKYNTLDKKKIKKKNIKHDNFLKTNLKIIFSKSYTFNFAAGARNFIILKSKDKHNLNFKYKYLKNNIDFNINNIDQDELSIAKKIYFNELNENYIKNAFVKPILKIKDLSLNNNSILVFIYIPSAHNVIKDDIIFENEDSQKYLDNMSKLQTKIFSEVCKNHNLNCLNVTKVLYDYNKKNKALTYFPSNLHLTPEGHEVIGETVGKYLYKLIKKNEK